MGINVYRLMRDGSLKAGYPRHNRSIQIGVHGGRVVTVYLDARSLPRSENGLVMEARPETFKGAKVLAARSSFEGALLIINVSALVFPEQTSSRFQVENAWPGAGTLDDAWVQVGSRKSPIQAQGIWIPKGENLIVADLYSRYIELFWNGVELSVRPADSLRCALFLVRRARHLSDPSKWDDVRDRNQMFYWTQHAVRALGHFKVWPGDLDRLISRK